MKDAYDNTKVKCKFCGIIQKNIWRLVDHVRWSHSDEYNKNLKERRDYYSKYFRKLKSFNNILNLKEEEEKL